MYIYTYYTYVYLFQSNVTEKILIKIKTAYLSAQILAGETKNKSFYCHCKIWNNKLYQYLEFTHHVHI